MDTHILQSIISMDAEIFGQLFRVHGYIQHIGQDRFVVEIRRGRLFMIQFFKEGMEYHKPEGARLVFYYSHWIRFKQKLEERFQKWLS